MRELPIFMITPLVRATMDGKKTQTRRLIRGIEITETKDGRFNYKGKKIGSGYNMTKEELSNPFLGIIKASPYQVGDHLYVRESATVFDYHDPAVTGVKTIPRMLDIQYEVDGERRMLVLPDRIKMPQPGNKLPNGVFKEAARLWLEVTDVRVERLQDILEEDAIAEGVLNNLCSQEEELKCQSYNCLDGGCTGRYSAVESFATLWQSMPKGRESWQRNDWVFVYTFKKIEK